MWNYLLVYISYFNICFNKLKYAIKFMNIFIMLFYNLKNS